MRRNQYLEMEAYMLSCMQDAVHDKLHVYRVVNYALQLAEEIPGVDTDVVVAAALLHDIGRKAEQENPALCHAQVGSAMAEEFLRTAGYGEGFAHHVAQCILSHRHRQGQLPESSEAQIVYDADKLDLIGNVGVARAILFGGQIDEPLYLLDNKGIPTPGIPREGPSLFREYHRKLRDLQAGLHTPQAKKLAKSQQEDMNRYFESLIQEVNHNHRAGRQLLEELLE